MNEEFNNIAKKILSDLGVIISEDIVVLFNGRLNEYDKNITLDKIRLNSNCNNFDILKKEFYRHLRRYYQLYNVELLKNGKKTLETKEVVLNWSEEYSKHILEEFDLSNSSSEADIDNYEKIWWESYADLL